MIVHDIGLAFRSLRSTPVVTAVALLSLALGIGANTAIFSLVDALVLRTLPVPHPEQLVALSNGETPPEHNDFSFAAFDQIRRHAGPFTGGLAFSHCCGQVMLGAGREQWAVDRFFVSGDFFTTLGLTAAAGRVLTPADDVVGGGAGGPKVVISHRLWRERFGGGADAIGTPVVIERVPATIVGVTPADFHGMEIGRGFDVILPEQTEPLILAGTPFDDTISWLSVMLRLEPGVSVDAAAASLRAAQPQIRAASLPRSFQSEFLKAPFTLTPAGAGTSALRQRFERPLTVLLLVVVLVLLVACANVANVQLARGAARAHELSVRLALGVSRARPRVRCSPKVSCSRARAPSAAWSSRSGPAGRWPMSCRPQQRLWCSICRRAGACSPSPRAR